jgi:hypothetical protein
MRRYSSHCTNGRGSGPAGQLASGAERTGQTLERIRAEPLALRDFLKRMPKGADLHSHLMPRRIFAMRLPTGYAWIRTLD